MPKKPDTSLDRAKVPSSAAGIKRPSRRPSPSATAAATDAERNAQWTESGDEARPRSHRGRRLLAGPSRPHAGRRSLGQQRNGEQPGGDAGPQAQDLIAKDRRWATQATAITTRRPAGAGAQDRPGPEGGSGEESSSPAALGISPQDQSLPDPPGGGGPDEAATAKPDRRNVATPGEGASRTPGGSQGDEVDPGVG